MFGGDSQFYLGADLRAAADLENSSDLPGSFSHTKQTPMGGLFSIREDLWLDAATVVENSYSKISARIRYFNFDFFSSGMLKSIR
jgi:hypothetical protein